LEAWSRNRNSSKKRVRDEWFENLAKESAMAKIKVSVESIDGYCNLPMLVGDHFYIDNISGERLAEVFKLKNKACFNCNVHCSRYYASGSFEAEGPEFETLCGFTSRIGNDGGISSGH
jgi:aldehyde:ferredoxin oxidoreductase